MSRQLEAVFFDFGRTLYDPVEKGLFPNTVDVLENIRSRGLAIGLVSIALTDNTEERVADLERLGIKHFFDEVQVIPRSNPVKDFRLIARKLNVETADSMVVGDNLKRDIAPGNEVGAFTVWTKERLLGNFMPETTLQIPNETINHLREMLPLLEQLI